MQKNTDAGTRSLALDAKSSKPSEAVTSANLPQNVSMQLYEIMKKVVADEITPATVNAACNCAAGIHKFLKFNLELKRGGL